MMFQQISRISILILGIFALSYGLPPVFDAIFLQDKGNPLLFFSPLSERFIYRESLPGQQLNYQDQTGRQYKRVAFEAQLPFLYYKTLEKRKLLPVEVQGRLFDEQAIKAGKQGFEIKWRHLTGNHPQIELYPLFNNDPQNPMLPFPQDVFHFTDREMVFINARNNTVDRELTTIFSDALKAKGFSFPATATGGKTTNLKPFDEGYFVRDSRGFIFHIKRVLNKPVIVKTPIPPSLDIFAIVISENKRKEFYGALLTKDGGLYLIGWGDYALTKLPTKANGLQQDHKTKGMDFKILVNPLFKTIIVGTEDSVTGTVVMPNNIPRSHYTLSRRNNTPALITVLRQFLFPFQISIKNRYFDQAHFSLRLGGAWSLPGLGAAIGLFFCFSQRKTLKKHRIIDFLVVLSTGFYGLLTVLVIPEER